MAIRLSVRSLALAACLLGAAGVQAQETPRFDIRSFKVGGNSLLPQEVVDKALAPFKGTGKDFGDVQSALEALEAAYRDRGYSSVTVLLPEQVLESGDIKFQVIEGRIRKINITGNQHFDNDNIRASLPSLKVGESPVIDDISASLKVANENPSKKLVLKLAAGEQDEDIDANITVQDSKPWQGGLSLDNTGTSSTGEMRLGLSLLHANLFNRDHVAGLQYITSPEKSDAVQVAAASYRVPLYALGDTVDFYAAYSDVSSGNIAVGPITLGVSGKGSILGSKYTLNLKRRGNYEHQLMFGLEQRTYLNDLVQGGVNLGNDLRVRPLAVQYGGRQQGDAYEAAFTMSLARNLPGGDLGDSAAFNLARAGADSRYSILRLGGSYSRSIFSDWQWRIAATGQWTRDKLVPGEQFGLGGASSIRGLHERALANDRGFQANFELYTPELCAGMHSLQCRVLAFHDLGRAWRIDALPAEDDRISVGSVGLGIRVIYSNSAVFQADVGHVVDGHGSTVPVGENRLHGRLNVSF